MLELVRYQERALPKAAGAEETYITTREILNSEKNRHRQVGKYMERISHSLSVFWRAIFPIFIVMIP